MNKDQYRCVQYLSDRSMSSLISLRKEDIPVGRFILLTDDLIATGGTLNAARSLIEAGGVHVLEIFGIVGFPFLNYVIILAPTPITTLIQYHVE